MVVWRISTEKMENLQLNLENNKFQKKNSLTLRPTEMVLYDQESENYLPTFMLYGKKSSCCSKIGGNGKSLIKFRK